MSSPAGLAISAISSLSRRQSEPAHDWMRGQSRQNNCSVVSSNSSMASWAVTEPATSSKASIASRSCWAASAMGSSSKPGKKIIGAASRLDLKFTRARIVAVSGRPSSSGSTATPPRTVTWT